MMEISIPAGPLLSLAKAVTIHHDHFIPLVKSYRYLFRKKIRISMAALVRMEIDDSYFLLKNRHRPEYLAPFGGVFKYFPDAIPFLDNISFEKESKSSTDKDLTNDLRGYIPAYRFGDVMSWFKKRTHREQTECLHREMREELQEAGVPIKLRSLLANMQFSLVRTVYEGPFAHDALDHASFRYIEIYSQVKSNETTQALISLSDWCNTKKCNVRIVSKKEIDNLRSNSNEAIAGSAKYFFSNKWHGFEPSKF